MIIYYLEEEELKTYLFPIGFHEDFIFRRLHKTKALPEDKIIIYTCKPVVGGVKRALENLKAHLIGMGLGEPEIIELECFNIPDSIYKVRTTLPRDAEEIILDLSGGMRVLDIILYTALILERKPFTTYFQPESGEPLEAKIPKHITPHLWTQLTPEEKQILETIQENPGITTQELAEKLGKKPKTIQNQLTKLRRKGLITKKGRNPNIYPTPWTKAIHPHPPNPDQTQEQHNN